MRRICPSCPIPLARFSLRSHVFYDCDDHGLLVPLKALASFFKSPELARHSQQQLTDTSIQGSSQRRCPECQSTFATFDAHTFGPLPIDVCRRCKLFWFDRGEWEVMQKAELHAPLSEEHLPRAQRPRRRPPARSGLEVTAHGVWDLLATPMEESERVKTTPPVLTFMFAGFAFLATALALKEPRLMERWAFYPDAFFRGFGFSHLSSLALHFSYGHYFSNLPFLILAGDDVEDEVGHLEFLKLFIFSGIAGHVAYVLAGGLVPSMGMSGAVAGLMTYYCLRFPNHRINELRLMRWGLGFFVAKLSFSARSFMVVFVLTNVFGLLYQMHNGGGGINYAAHIGGMVFGALYAFLKADHPANP